MCLCSCLRLRLRLPLAMAAAHVRQGTRPHANSNCQMPDGRTQESHARRVLPRAGNNILWNSETDMGCFENGIALSLHPAAAAAATYAAAHILEPARTIHTCLQPLCVPSPTATIPPRHLSIRGRSTGDDTAGNPDSRIDSRTIGQSARPIADLDPDGQNNVPVPGQSDGSTRRLHVAGENN